MVMHEFVSIAIIFGVRTVWLRQGKLYREGHQGRKGEGSLSTKGTKATKEGI